MMKRCNYCKKDYVNGDFCTVCGGRLTEITSDNNIQTHIHPQDNHNNIPSNDTSSKNNSWAKWDVYLTTGIGVLVWWFINQWVGLIICYSGVKLAYNSKKPLKKAISLFVAILASIVSLALLAD